MPAFFLGLILQVIFFRSLDVLPLAGRIDSDLRFTSTHRAGHRLPDHRRAARPATARAFVDVMWHLVLPALTLAAYPIGLIARMTRASMLESMQPGLRPDRARLRHRRSAGSTAAWRCATRCCRC